jgi:hypothetical protein
VRDERLARVITENTPRVRPWSTDRSSCDPAGDLWGWDCGADQLAAVEMMGDVVSRQLVETHVQVALGEHGRLNAHLDIEGRSD